MKPLDSSLLSHHHPTTPIPPTVEKKTTHIQRKKAKGSTMTLLRNILYYSATPCINGEAFVVVAPLDEQ
jgi:hypothetical protein